MDVESYTSKLTKFANGLSSIKLRDFIRQIRTTRTAADERTVIEKECANIRSLFREENNTWRCRNVGKLLYIHILGYQAHFGQLECLKLIASPRFKDKRIGYLGSMLLLDEKQDIHLLITNSLKNDLNGKTQYATGLALSTLGVICSPDMSKDLAGEVEKLLKTSNDYIKKKAAICAFRIINKNPELTEMFIPATRGLLSEKSHGVLISSVVLITEMCEKSPDILHHFKQFVSNLVRILKNSIVVSEHDASASDPFLQVKILKLLRLLGKNDPDASEIMNDILTQVATNTETSKRGGNAVLYETVLSIMDINCESSLKTLGVNMLGRFLLNTDRNVKFVGLNAMLCTVHTDYIAVQRHRSTIVECLKDPDLSIRKKAMELCFVLINENNIISMTEDLLVFLENSDPELKSRCSFNLCMSAELYAPSRRWLIDTVIQVLNLAGDNVIDDVVGNLIQLISVSTSLHAYTVQQLWKQLTSNLEIKQPLIQVASWCIGEFGDLLNSVGDQDVPPINVTPDEIIDMFEKITMNSNTNLISKEYSTTTLMKLSVRFPDTASRVKQFLDVFATNISAELQQRAVEFSSLFKKYNYLCPSILERMPVMENKGYSIHTTIQNTEIAESKSFNNVVEENKKNYEKTQDHIKLLDLLSDLPESTSANEASMTNIKSQSYSSDLFDLLGCLDLDSRFQNTYNSTMSNTFLDSSKSSQSISKYIPPITAYDKNNLKITFEFVKPHNHPHKIIINLITTNSSSVPIIDFWLQVAVPKLFQLQLLSPTNNIIPANNVGNIQQKIIILNPTKSELRIKLKISYTSNCISVVEVEEVRNIPREVWM